MDAQELRNLQEAYREVVMNELDEEKSPIPRGTPMNKRWPYISNKDPDFQTALDRVNKKKSKKKDVSAESYDIYDIILSHLLDEGYAETPEAAEAIMVNMSEEWRDDILQQLDEADSLAAFRARREKRRAAMKKKTGYGGHDYSKPHAQASAEREARMQAFLNKGSKTTKEAFNIFVNTLISEGMSLDNYSWDDLQYAFDEIFLESSQANRDPERYEREARKKESRGETAERRVRSRLATMDPEARKKMEAQMRAVGLNV